MSWFRTVLLLIIVLVFTRFIPFSSFFRNVNTLIHELSHAIVALLSQGRVMEIHLYADQSGVTYTQLLSGWGLILVACAGYVGASLFALILFQLYSRGSINAGLWLISILAGTSLILFVRNDYGVVWSLGFTFLTVIITLIAPHWLKKGYFFLIACLCLVEAVISSLIIVYLAITSSSEAGDATSLSEATGLPAIIWSLLFAIFALWCFKKSMHLFFHSPRRQTSHHPSD